MPFGTGTEVTYAGFAVITGRIMSTPTTNAPRYVAVGTGATAAARTAAKTDIALSTEVESRGIGTETQVTTSQTQDTYRVVGVVTMTANRTIDEAALFTASSGGTMFLSATFTGISLNINDSLQITANAQFT